MTSKPEAEIAAEEYCAKEDSKDSKWKDWPLQEAAFLAGVAWRDKWVLEKCCKKAYPSEVDSDGEAASDFYWVKLDDIKKLLEPQP